MNNNPHAAGDAAIDGRIMGTDHPGPVSTRIRDTFWARRAEGWHAMPVNHTAATDR